jgi:predicted transcriptional regulator
LIADTEFQFVKTIGDVCEWSWKGAADALKRQILTHLDDGISQTDIKDMLGISKSYVSKVRAQAVKDGWLTKENKLTQNGFQHAGRPGNS